MMEMGYDDAANPADAAHAKLGAAAEAAAVGVAVAVVAAGIVAAAAPAHDDTTDPHSPSFWPSDGKDGKEKEKLRGSFNS